MKKITRRSFLQAVGMTGLAAGMMSVMSGCGGSSSSTVASGSTAASSEAAADVDLSKIKDTIHMAVSQEASSYDVHKTTTLIARQVFAGTVWEKLVTLNANSEVIPELCSSYEMSDDACTFTFHLREGVKFHDGSTLSAEDVVASLNRWIDAYSNAAAMVGEGRFEATDDLTVTITCSAPALTLPDMMAGAAQPAIITTAACCTDEDANGYLNQYIGTGPYKFIEWKQDQYIKLEKFDDYCPYYLEGTTEEKMDGWGGYKHAYTKTIYIDKVAETATRVAGLQSGDYDVIWGVGSENTPMVEADPNLTLMSEQAGTLCMVFNKDPSSIASNNDIRRAVNAVANCDDLMASAFGTDYDLGSCYMDDLNAYWVTDAGKENYDLRDADKAKAYLESAGYNGETFTILAPTLNNYNNIGLVLQEELKSIGMNAELTTVDWATFMEYRKDPSVFDIYITSFASVPLPSLKAYYGPSYPGWTTDEKTAELLEEFNEATTRDDALAVWKELQEYSWDYLPCISTGHYHVAYACSSKVHGLYMGNGIYLWNAYAEA